MHSRFLFFILILLLVPLVLISCDREETPKKEKPDKEEEFKAPGKRVFLYEKSEDSDSDDDLSIVFVPSDTTNTQTVVIGSASFYEWIEDVKKRLAREKLEDANTACIQMQKIGKKRPEHLDTEYKLDLQCVNLNTEEPSHTDPSPLDDVDQWVVCQAAGSDPGSSGPGGNPGGGPGGDPGSGPSDPGVGPGGDSGGDADGDDSGSGSDTVDSLAEILCTPAVGAQPGVDPRLIYPAPDQVEAVVANIAPCVDDFCPFEIVFEVPDLEDPTEPIDPSPIDPEELTEIIRDQLMCDKFRGLCDPDVSLITKNDLVLGKDDKKDDNKDDEEDDNEEDKTAKDGKCDGVDFVFPGEECEEIVGRDNWTICKKSTVSEGSMCIEKKGEGNYEVTHARGVTGNRPSVDEQGKREQEAMDDQVFLLEENCKPGKIDAPRGQNMTTIPVTCN